MSRSVKHYGQIAKFVEEYPWAMMEGPLEAMLEVLEVRLAGGRFTAEEIQDRVASAVEAAAARRETSSGGGAVAVLPVQGVISHRMNMLTAMSGGLSTELLGKALDQAVADPGVAAIVLDVDSPGGSVFGVQELGDKIFRARGTKPIIAVANATAASAAYWIASQADELIVTPSGQVGSIGAMAVHIDRSKQAEMLGVRHTIVKFGENKAEGTELAPLSEAARADMQMRVDQYGKTFVKAVARGRGVTSADVMDRFGQGRMFNAIDAVKLGMADGLGTLEDVIGRLGSGSRSAIAAETPTPAVEAEATAGAEPTPTVADEVADFRRQLAAHSA